MTLKTDELNSKLEDLKHLCYNPCFFLSHYFFDLKNEVDKNLACQSMHEPDLQIKQQMKDIWIEIIDEIETYENKCYQKILSKESINFTIKKINSIKALSNNVKCANFNKIEQLIEAEEYRIQNDLFLNKTFLIVNGSSANIKLLIINDEFISRRGIDFLKSG